MKLRSTKLLRAVTFSSLAALTSLIACGDDDDQLAGTAGSSGSNSNAGKAGANTGGNATAGSSNGGAATAGKGGMTSVAGNTTAGAAGTSVAGSGGTSVAGSGGSSVAVAGAGGDTASGGDAGGGGDTANAGAGGSGETVGAGGMGGAPDVPPTPINLSIGKTATSSSAEAQNPTASGIDDNVTTRWCASNGDAGNWISVDLGASHTLTGVEIVWEKGTGTDQPTAKYQYKIEVSTDNVAWTSAVDQSANVSAEQTQANAFAADARYVKLTVLGVADPNWLWASAYEVRVMGF